MRHSAFSASFLGALALAFAAVCFAGPRADLDMPALEKRLQDTPAMSHASKLTLKSQLDELVVRFRQMHEGGSTANVGDLRQPYEKMLVRVYYRVVRDPELAGDLIASRESIWRGLSDPVRFRGPVTQGRCAGCLVQK